MDDTLHQRPAWNLFEQIGVPTILLMLGLLCVFTIDYSVGKHFVTLRLHGELRDFVDAVEHFGTPYGQTLILLCLVASTGWKERRVYRILAGATAAGLVANVLKLLIGRTRPNAFDFDNSRIFDSFTGWFPFHSGGSQLESFPSAHTASAFGFAALLIWTFPKGRVVFILMGLLVGVHRVTAAAHFPSDVFTGAAVGWFMGYSFTYSTWVTRKFDWLERRGRP
jgi:membrane-associated phospholipid phosphatase